MAGGAGAEHPGSASGWEVIKRAIAGAVAGLVLFGSAADAKNPAYQHYRHEVDKQTSQVYGANKGTIDPHALRGRGYDLDHKISVKECYRRGMSVNFCAAPSNLQMLDSHTNRSLGCKSVDCRKP
jgi:hypothetical protein